MMEEAERRRHTRKRLWLLVVALSAVLAVIFVPPMLSTGRYRVRITQLVSKSLGRPVRLSSVEFRLLPRPGFVLTDLTVQEDPAFGAEPVLHANTVTASVRLLSLFQGHLEISRISVDEASLNLVRTSDGRWNLDPLFRTAAAHSNSAAPNSVKQLPYLEATNSRINIKNGLEKLPFSLVNADVSFWQEDPGDWRLRLRGQPARTDVNLDLADTGIVRLEASLRRAPELRQMPVHIDAEWRKAQLGQLTRLILGSDPGWRGDLTGEMQVDGTAGEAQVKTRLSASGVHRTEFAPADALDFDANCTFAYHYSGRSIENLACDSPLGDGHVKLAGELPASGPGRLAVQVQRIPVSAGLDALRTVRSGIGDDLDARGTISGQITYDPAAAEKTAEEAPPGRHESKRNLATKKKTALPSALQGSLIVEGFRLSGNGLSQPIQIAKVTLQPAASADGEPEALTTAVTLPMGAPSPVDITANLTLTGYQVTAHGQATLPRVRELAHAFGIAGTSALDSLAGEPAVLDLAAKGPWLPAPSALQTSIEPAAVAASSDHATVLTVVPPDQLSGTITLHNANWKSEALSNHVQVTEATLHLGADDLVWDPVEFTFGSLKGTARLRITPHCEPAIGCPPQLDLQFDSLDAAALQETLLGAKQQGTALSTLIARFTSSSVSAWPRLNGTVKAGSLVLGPVTLEDAVVTFRVLPTGAEFTSIEARLLGGQLNAAGTLVSGDKPAYTMQGTFEKLTGPALCEVLNLRCTGGPIDGNGKIALTGFAGADLASSATGALQFDWRHGGVNAASPAQFPKALTRFDRWTADAAIDHGALTLKQNQVQLGGRKSAVEASITFGESPKVAFQMPKATTTAKR
jgi:hypothetical protein